MSEKIEEFVAQAFRNAVKVAPNHWVAGGQEAVSYYEEGHDENATYEDRSFWFQQRNVLFRQLIEQFSIEQPMIDVGGGTGVVGNHLITQGVSVVNVEPTNSGAMRAIKRGVPTIISTLEKAEAREGSLNSVGLFDVLEHIEDAEGALATISAALKPGGHLIVAVPAHQWLWSIEDVTAGHFRRYNRSTLRKAVEHARLEPLLVSHLFSYLTAPLFAARTLTSFWGRIGDKDRENKEDIHVPSASLMRLFDTFGRYEKQWIANGRTIRLGTTVFCVARKPS